MFRVWFGLSFIFFTGFAVLAQSEEARLAEYQKKISNLESNLDRLQNKLNELRTGAGKVSEEVQRLELERAVLSGTIEKHEIQIANVEAEIERSRRQRGELQDRATIQKHNISKRLRGLYKRGNLGYAHLLLKQSKRDDLLNAYHYAKVLTKKDHDLLDDYRRTIQQLEAVEAALVSYREEASHTRDRLQEREADLETLQEKRKQALAEIRGKAAKQKQLLDELELEKQELVFLVRRLSDAESDPMQLRVPMSRYKGKLDWPSNAPIRRKFGVYRDPEFLTKRRLNGIELKAEVGQPIQAVYSGRVIYADWFKSYGNLIIVDHGEKITTFYAHCNKLMVAKGDFVEAGQVIAESGDTGSLVGPLLHFELRKRTTPENPTAWLKRR